MRSIDSLQKLTVELNNEGVEHLKGGDCWKAIRILHLGLQCSKMVVSRRKDDTPSLKQRTLSLDKCMSMGECRCSIQGHDDQPFLHVGPVIIPQDLLASRTITDRQLSSILIFNQALAHHALGMKDSQFLRTALELYKCGLDLVMAGKLRATSYSFILACHHNMGRIHLFCHDVETAQKQFQQVMSILVCLVDRRHPNAASHMDVYFQSISHLMFEAAPAAAVA